MAADGRRWPRIKQFVCGVVALCMAASVAASITVTDDLGRTVELKRPAQRIVALAPFLTELAFSAGVGARVVGASAFSDYPAEARAIPRVASAAGISLESLASLHPDLVLAWADTLRAPEVERIERLGAAVFVARVRKLEDVPRLLESTARLSGVATPRAANDYRGRVAKLRAAHAGLRPLRTLVEIWPRPLTTIGAGHWIDEALEICGAANAFADLPGVAPQLDLEIVYRRDPQAIVATGPRDGEAAFLERWGARGTLAAVRSGRLVYIDADLLERPTLRLADGVTALCAGLDRVR